MTPEQEQMPTIRIDTACVSRCECRSGSVLVTDTQIVDWLQKADWRFKSYAGGLVVFERPWAVKAQSIRDAVTWMILNNK